MLKAVCYYDAVNICLSYLDVSVIGIKNLNVHCVWGLLFTHDQEQPFLFVCSLPIKPFSNMFMFWI